MNENNLGELCQKVSSLKDSGAASRVEAAALPLTELASAGLSAPPLVPNLDGRAFRYKSAVKERRSQLFRYGRAADLAQTIECLDSKPTMILEEA